METQEQIGARVKLMKNIIDIQQTLHEHGLSHEKSVEIILESVIDVYKWKFPDFDYKTLDEDVKSKLKELSPKNYEELMQ